MLFQMVPFILLSMVAHSTITWLVETIATANQRALCWWFLKLPWREKRKVPSERAMKTESETGVKSDTPFCSKLQIQKTNSAVCKELKWSKKVTSRNDFLCKTKIPSWFALQNAICLFTEPLPLSYVFVNCQPPQKLTFCRTRKKKSQIKRLY